MQEPRLVYGTEPSSGEHARLAAATEGESWTLGRRNLLDSADWDLRMLYSMAG